MGVQINGKTRGSIDLAADATEADAKAAALADAGIQKHLADKEIKKVIYVKGRILNLVV
jgi:leucyl-tRNA synthetase